MPALESPFTAILNGQAPGKVIARNDQKQFALIQSLEPEAAIHWLAIPYEQENSTEEMANQNSARFLELIDYAVKETKLLTADYPILEHGFTLKFHFGPFETLPFCKLHILSSE
jgi:histidine triad (HIT) family protein